MKKSFWGYSVQEVDELVDSLQSQNDILTSKLASLNMELTALKEEKTVALEAPVIPVASELPEFTAMQQETQRLERENTRLQAELRAKKQEVSECRDEIEQVGLICQRAYSDMETAKQNMSAQMQQYVDQFASQAEASRTQMHTALQNIREARDRVNDSFLQAAEVILENLESFSGQTAQIEEVMLPVAEIRRQLEQALAELLTQKKDTAGDVAQEDAALGAENGQADLPQSVTRLERALYSARQKTDAPVSAQKDEREPVGGTYAPVQPAAEKKAHIIAINTRVKTNDILGDTKDASSE